MKLFFDARFIRTDGRHDGLSRYSWELGRALSQQADVTFIVSSEAQKAMLPDAHAFVLFHDVDSWKEPFSSFFLNKYKPDVVFSPMQTMGSLGRRFKLILTLHDMTYYVHRLPPPGAKGIVRPIWRLFHMAYWPQRLILNRADIVATVSKTSEDAIKKARLTKRPMIVVSNAAPDLSPFLEKPPEQREQPAQNLVFMNTPLPYKNTETLIKAMEFLPGRTLHVLSRISDKRLAELQKLIPNGANVIFHRGVSDEDYARLLADNGLMVSASKSEGYGLSLAEALKLGTPAVVSDRPFFIEVAGEGATYADPESPEDFAAKIRSLDPLNVRLAQIEAGKRHIERFSWDESAKILLDSCNQLTEK